MISVLSCLVVFCTTYALILPAITASKPTYCGKEEHTHTSECGATVLTCTLPEDANHVHTAQCNGTVRVQICDLPENAGHVHTEACNNTVTYRLCGFEEESEAHTHTADCFETRTYVACGLNENAGHTHTDACFVMQDTLVCNPHVHTSSCYTQQNTCGKAEHRHTSECYEVPDETETQNAAEWKKKLPEELTGHWANDLLAAVRSQMGYTESVADREESGNGRTFYGEAYGVPYANWDAAFVSWALEQIGVPKAPGEEVTVYFPQNGNTEYWTADLQSRGLFHEGKDGWNPRPGDLMFFSVDGGRGFKRVSVVVEAAFDEEGNLSTVRSIMGDCEDKVDDIVWNVGALTIQGWARLPVNPDHIELYTDEEKTETVILHKPVDEEKAEEESAEEEIEETVILGEANAYLDELTAEEWEAFLMKLLSSMNSSDLGIAAYGLDDEVVAFDAGISGVNLEPYMTKVSLKYHDYHEGADTPTSKWDDLPTDGSTIPANAHIRIAVNYYGIDPAYLKANDYRIVYKPSELLTHLSASSQIKVGSQVRGTVHSENGSIILEYDPDWIDMIVKQNEEDETGNNSVIYGDFYFQGELDLSKLDEEGGHHLNLGPVSFDIPVTGDAAAAYGKLDIDKAEPILVEENGARYLEYTLTATTGDYPMNQVKVVDRLMTNKFLPAAPYVGITTAPVSTSSIAAVTEGSSKTGFTPGTVAVAAASANTMTWDIGNMAAHEVRTLTYRVSLKDEYFGIFHNEDSMISNQASISSKDYPHGNDTTKYMDNGTLTLEKGHQGLTKLDNGDYQVDYWIAVQAPSSNDYTMTDVKVVDNIWERTPEEYREYVHYVDSLELYKCKDNNARPGVNNIGGAFSDDELAQRKWNYFDGGKGTVLPELSDDTGFTAHIGDLAPGERVYLKYTMILQKEALSLGNNAGIKNRAKVFDDYDNTVGGNKEINAWNHDVNPLDMTWDRKLAPGELTLQKQIPMGRDDVVLDATNGLAPMPNPGSFTAPAGSFEYYVVVNESGQNGHWNLSSTTMQDTLGTGLKYSGYVQVSRYRNVNNAGNAATLDSLLASGSDETVWVYVQDLTTFQFSASDLGFGSSEDAFVLHYFADNNNTSDYKVVVGNSFNLNGAAYGPGGQYLLLQGVNVHVDVTVPGGASITTTKEPWYYDPHDTQFSYVDANGNTVYPGALYWAIRIDGKKVKNGMIFEESTHNNGNVSTEYFNILHPGPVKKNDDGSDATYVWQNGPDRQTKTLRNIGEGSFVGFYLANLRDGNTVQNVRDLYPTLNDAISSGAFKPVETDFVVYTGASFDIPRYGVQGEGIDEDSYRGFDGKNYDMDLLILEDLAIPADHSAYLLVKTEPYVLPAESSAITSKTYSNKANIFYPNADPSKRGSWPEHPSTSMTVYGGTNGLLKQSGGFYQVKTENGTQTFQKFNETTKAWTQFNPTIDGEASQKSDFASAFLRVDGGLEETRLNKNSLTAAQKSRNYAYDDGYYVSWVLSVNTTNQLVGPYDLIDTLPSGVQLMYARPYGMMNSNNNNDISGANNSFKFTSSAPGYNLWPTAGKNGAPEDVWTYPKSDIEPGWTLHMSQSPLATHSMNWNRVGCFYYTKDNQVLFHFNNLVKTSKPVQMQVVCKVTDPNMYFEDVELYNTSSLYNQLGIEVDARSAPITVRSPSLGKKDLANVGGTLSDTTLPYIIEINAERADMDGDSNYISVPLIDSMSSNLAIDMDTLMLYKEPTISTVTKEPVLTWSVVDVTGVKLTDVNSSVLYKTKTSTGEYNVLDTPGVYVYNGYKLTTTANSDTADKLTTPDGRQLYYLQENGSRVKATPAEYGGHLYIYNSSVLTAMKGNDEDAITYNARNVVKTNLVYSNALKVQKQNANGQRLYLTAAGVETTAAEEDAQHPNTPIYYDVGVGPVLRYDEQTNTITRALTRVSQEQDRNADGTTTGRTNVLFHYLPDSVRLVASYSVTATFGGNTATYDNKAYWSGHGESDGGNTATDGAQVEAGASSGIESHGAVQVTKYDGKDTSVRLEGAGFALYRAAYEVDEVTNEPAIFDSNRNGVEVFSDFEVNDNNSVTVKYFYDRAFTQPVTDTSGLHHHYLTDAKGNVLLDAVYIDSQNRSINPATGQPYGPSDDGVRPKAFEYVTDQTTGQMVIKRDANGNPVLDSHVLGYGVTNSDGVVTYGLAGAGQDRIHFNKIYCVVEAEAPAGYMLDSSEHFFVVPNENQNGTYDGKAVMKDGVLDRTYVNYFYRHDNNICHVQTNSADGWPANVHEVRLSRNNTMTYFLSMANFKNEVKVTKSFGGNATNPYIPGTYTFGIWRSANTMGVEPLSTGAITYTQSDFGWFVDSADSKHLYKEENGKWYEWIPSSAGESPFAGTQGRWSECIQPQNVTYGILPGREQVIVFDSLDNDTEYFVYEMIDGAAILDGESVEMNGVKFTVTYEAEYVDEDGQKVIDKNKVIPRKDGSGLPIVPVVVGTNSVYELDVSKSFIKKGIPLEEGILGEYRFGIWKVPESGAPDLTKAPLDIQTITWLLGDKEPEKQARFTNLEPCSYVVYELDNMDRPVMEGGMVETGVKQFIVDYSGSNQVSIHSGTTLLQKVTATNEPRYFALPRTGGIGTTIFYVIGGILAVGALILLVTKKRMDDV